MMAGPTRMQKRVAMALLLIAIGLAAVSMFWVWSLTISNLERLEELYSRNEASQAQIAAAGVGARPSFEADWFLMGGIELQPEEQLTEHLRLAAQAKGLAFEAEPIGSGTENQRIEIFVSVTGSPQSVADWLTSMEGGRPLVRFRDWQIVQMETDVTFSGLAGGVALR